MQLDILHTPTILKVIIMDAMHDDIYPLVGLVHWLTHDKGYTMERLVKFAVRTLKLDETQVVLTLEQCGLNILN